MLKLTNIAIAAAFLLGTQGVSRAALTPILDQIGPNSSYVQGGNAYTDQIFGAPYNKDNVAVVDNFSIASPNTTLAEVDAAVLGFGGFAAGDYKNITAVHVEIYSSLTAAAGSLTGDVYDDSVDPSAITLTAPYGSDKFSAMAQLSINVTLGVGTYYIAVIPALNFNSTGAEIGVYASTYAGDSNAYQVNPGGGFGFTNNTNPLGVNAAYRILATTPSVVPEPSSLFLFGVGGVGVMAVARTRRKSVPA